MKRPVALVMSTHPLPGVAVTVIAVILGIGVGLEPGSVILLGLAFLLNQASVGLSNDWLDADRDRAVGRTDKPVARGDLSPAAARNAAFIAAAQRDRDHRAARLAGHARAHRVHRERVVLQPRA